MEPDEFEHIPWSSLMAEHRSQRTKLLYLVAGVIVAVVVGFVAVRWLSGPQHGEASSDAPQTTVAADEVQPAVEVTPPEPPPPPKAGVSQRIRGLQARAKA